MLAALKKFERKYFDVEYIFYGVLKSLHASSRSYKTFFFANEEFFRFLAGKLACLFHIEKVYR
jgi:hypothetical protein